MKHRVILANELCKKLIEAGLVTANASRVVIDLKAGDAAKIYHVCFGDERLLDVFVPENLLVVNTDDAVR